MQYIHQRENWTHFRWNSDIIAPYIEEVSRLQGQLQGELIALGFDSQMSVMAENLSRDVISSSEIEGISLNMEQVRSSIARRMGIENVKFTAPSHYVESVVAVILRAVSHYTDAISHEQLWRWQSAFFPNGISEGLPIEVGMYRTHREQVVSGMFGREKVHYVAPDPECVKEEMEKFITWFNEPHPQTPSVVQSAIAHLWMVLIHPFEDGNGRMSRILGDMMLARGDKSQFRFYNVSSAINRDRHHYYDVLERIGKSDGDVTEWLVWYCTTIRAALLDAQKMIDGIVGKSLFWHHAGSLALNERQIQILNLYLDGYEGKISSKNWAKLGKCSTDTAIRDIQALEAKGLLRSEVPGAKRPTYAIVYPESGH